MLVRPFLQLTFLCTPSENPWNVIRLDGHAYQTLASALNVCLLPSLTQQAKLVHGDVRAFSDVTAEICRANMIAWMGVQDAEMMEQIDRDVMRTHPGLHFFSGDDGSAVTHREVPFQANLTPPSNLSWRFYEINLSVAVGYLSQDATLGSCSGLAECIE